MYPNAVIQEIRGLLQSGELSRRAIAAKVGVSRGVVNNIASGARGLRRPLTNPSRPVGEHLSDAPKRCRRCGGLVYEPCLLCRARHHQQVILELRRQRALQIIARPSPRRVA
jgi:hypothetical protein